MKSSLSIIFIYCFYASLISCDNKSYRFKKESVLTDSINEQRFIIQKQFNRDEIKQFIQTVAKDSLIGVWADSITLVKEDDRWYGMRPIDKRIKLTFFQSGKYEKDEQFTLKKKDTIKYGQYWTSNYNDSSFLTLAFNNNGDTLFGQGDSVLASNFLIDYYKNDTLIIRPFNFYDHQAYDEAQIFIKK